MAVTVFQAREAAGMSQKELAGGANIDLNTISQIESGTGNPSVKTLVRIAQALNQSLSISIG
ncbi:helix-turn-helix domain-containing protein [Levilactobacillus fuyuanensis]|uniref:Multiprotein-bridging factor 1 family protein n=1 Tax=Levilactobacillus fuyuanensis TaxID=2486022 RepID=A0ABW4H1M5_9LACO